MIQGKFQESVG